MAKGRTSPLVPVISGKLAGVIFKQTRDGLVLAAESRKSGSQTEEQQLGRRLFAEASRRWSRELTHEERSAWDAAAARLGFRTGQTLFNGTSWMLEASGRGWRYAAPIEPAPPTVTAITATWSDDDATLRVRAEWRGTAGAGAMLFVESTGPSISPGRKPLPRELRAVCGLNAASFAEAGASGEEYVFPGVLRPVGTGQRYGLRVRLVSAEGVVGAGIWVVGVRA